MAITFNHTIVAAKDREESANFFTELFGLPSAKEFGPFLAVELNHGVSLDFAQVAEGDDIRPQHYAFLSTTTTAAAASTSRIPAGTTWKSSPGPTDRAQADNGATQVACGFSRTTATPWPEPMHTPTAP